MNITACPLTYCPVALLVLSNRSCYNRLAYICRVEYLLDNPVYHALLTGDAARSLGTGEVKFFDEQVSPFVGFGDEYGKGFDDLLQLMPAGRAILYATPKNIDPPKGWELLAAVEGLQFVYDTTQPAGSCQHEPVALGKENVEEMLQLTALTRPGPFGKRTIEFGHYYGLFENGQLAAMTGQRLHVSNYTEISAVCTHPDHLGKGFAGTLLLHQIDLIVAQGQIPFLHVRADNDRAIALYQRIGFKVRGPMNFYFLKGK